MDINFIEQFENFKEEQRNQIRLNLAINYMVIEHVLSCMTLDDQLFTEHEMLPVIFTAAKEGTLLDIFNSFLQQDIEKLKIIFELIYNITGLSPEVLSGVEQINLGIEVDPNNALAVKLSQMDTNDLNDYVEQRISNPIYDNLPWFYSIEEERQTNKALTEQVGQVNTTKEINYRAAAHIWVNNPLGLNTLGLFAYLVETGKIPAPENWNPIQDTDWEADLFETSFYTFKFSIIDEDGSSPKPQWKENIYSLNTITKFILRCLQDNKIWKKQIDDNSNILEEKYKVLDQLSIKLPYPLVIDVNKSDLLRLIYNLTFFGMGKDADRGYGFAPRYLEAITWSSIKDEIKHWEEYVDKTYKLIDRLLLNEQYLILGGISNSDIVDTDYKKTVAGHPGLTREMIIADIENTVAKSQNISEREENLAYIERLLKDVEYIKEEYISYLKDEQRKFDRDKAKWVDEMCNSLEEQCRDLRADRKELMKSLGIQSEKDLAAIWDEADKEQLFRFIRAGESIKFLTEAKSIVRHKADQNIPWIKVRQPYYRDTKIRI